MKKNIFFLIVLISLISILWVVQISSAKYKGMSQIDFSITSTPLYFEHSGTDIKIPYNNNTANINLTVHNYIDKYCTLENINYEISITNSNYTFSVDETSAIENVVYLEIEGGNRHSNVLNIEFTRKDTTDIPEYEDVEVVVKTTYPYSHQTSFIVTIMNGEIEVLGNPTNWTKEDVKLEIVHITEGTVLTEYSFDGGNTWQTESTKTYTKNVEGLQIYAKDTIGSILGPIEVDITKIDKTPPEFQITKDIEYNTDGTTKDVETLIVYLGELTSVLKNINAHDTQSGLSETGIKCYFGDMELITTDVATSVGRYKLTYKIQDNVGNESTIEREALVRWDTGGRYIIQRQQPIIVEQGATSNTGYGLYKDTTYTGLDTTLPYSSKYYYSGADVNNNLIFANNTFNVVNISVNDSVKLIGQVSSKNTKWGSGGTSKRKIYNSDIYADWKNWEANKWLYNDNDDNHIKFTDTEFSHIALATYYVGRFSKSSSHTLADVINLERTAAYELGGNESPSFEGYFAYPNVSDYLKAANQLDIIYNINTIQGNQSDYEDNSWLSQSNEQWTMNSKRDTSTDNDFWVLSGGTQIISRTNYYSQNYRPVFYLKDNTILSGTGTSGDPFVVQEDWRWFDSYQVLQ